jgi:hypothetical protein
MERHDTTSNDAPCLACSLVGPEFAARKEAITRDLFAHVDRVEELPDGFGVRFPAADPWAAKALEFIDAEKQCCPFFTFELAFEPDDGPLWLRLRGSEEIKAFVRTELGEVVTAPVSQENSQERNKSVVRRLVAEVLNGGRLDLISELYDPSIATEARAWIAPFRASFPDVRMEVVDLIAEGETVVGRFTCSATHTGEWLGHPPTGRRFERVDEVSIFRFRDGLIASAWGIEDNLTRLTQLGLA